jgi:hypothetical protein
MIRRQFCLRVFTLLLVATMLGQSGAYGQLDIRRVPVGVSGSIEQIVVSGALLEVAPIAGDASPIVLRIKQSYPHGSDYRYDLVYYGLEPGDYNLLGYLQDSDGRPYSGTDSIDVTIESVLTKDVVKPNELQLEHEGKVGGYWFLASILGIFWLIGLVLILVVGRGTKGQGSRQNARPRTVADRLRPMIISATEGSATHRELAELERQLVALWRRKLGLETLPTAVAIVQLREHPRSGPLLRELERWLHSPTGRGETDVEELLKPYLDVPESELGEPT